MRKGGKEPVPPGGITDALIVRNTPTEKKRNEPAARFVARITHLNLMGKQITQIVRGGQERWGPKHRLRCWRLLAVAHCCSSLPRAPPVPQTNLLQCHALRVLYLYDNQITDIVGLPATLTHLHLTNNRIRRMENLGHLKRLSKLCVAPCLLCRATRARRRGGRAMTRRGCTLRVSTRLCRFLEHNEIAKVEGLESCRELEELHVSNQRLPKGTELALDYASLEAIGVRVACASPVLRAAQRVPWVAYVRTAPTPRCSSVRSHVLSLAPRLQNSLRVLMCSGNQMTTVVPLALLGGLSKADLSKNNLAELKEVEPFLKYTPFLTQVDFRGNPVTKVRKYRDHIILASRSVCKSCSTGVVQSCKVVA